MLSLHDALPICLGRTLVDWTKVQASRAMHLQEQGGCASGMTQPCQCWGIQEAKVCKPSLLECPNTGKAVSFHLRSHLVPADALLLKPALSSSQPVSFRDRSEERRVGKACIIRC